MDSNQLTNALVDAAAAAKPAQEYCLAWIQQEWWSCMTKAEWSGWMQAVFSVVAIVAALVTALLIHWLAGRREAGRALLIADQIALGVSRRVAVFLNSETATLIGVKAVFDPKDGSAIRSFLVVHLQYRLASDAEMTALIPAKRNITTSLAQACANLEQCAGLLKLSETVAVPEEKAQKVMQMHHDTVSTAFAALKVVEDQLGKYLASRGYKDMQALPQPSPG